MSKAKIGVVDVGGGYRGIYAAGVLDYCMDNGIRFDTGIGVSAGSANLISFAARQRGQNYTFYSVYGLRKEYAGVKNYLLKRSFVDLDYVYSTLSNSDGENPLAKAFERGCERVVLILTLPEDTVRTSDRDRRLAAGIRKKYPLAAQRLEQRAQLYNEGIAMARRLRAQGKVLIIAPDDTCGVSTLSRDADALRQLYEKGYRDAEKIAAFAGETYCSHTKNK